MAYFADSKIYEDTLKVVAAALSVSTSATINRALDNPTYVSALIDEVFNKLSEINNKLKD